MTVRASHACSASTRTKPARQPPAPLPSTQVLALANSTRYGGAGYSNLATVAGRQQRGHRHRPARNSGHSFGDLADEYHYGDGATYTGSEPSEPNVSVLRYTNPDSQRIQMAPLDGSTERGYLRRSKVQPIRHLPPDRLVENCGTSAHRSTRSMPNRSFWRSTRLSALSMMRPHCHPSAAALYRVLRHTGRAGGSRTRHPVGRGWRGCARCCRAEGSARHQVHTHRGNMRSQ